nr:unnamed protein product [Callosobruchus chinensis]
MEKARCRICYEMAQGCYPLRGKIPNVDTDIADMLVYCTSVDLGELDGLPDSACIQCFKTLRIAYIFIKRFKETNEWLIDQQIKKELAEDHRYTKPYNSECSQNEVITDINTDAETRLEFLEENKETEEVIEEGQINEQVQQSNEQIQIIEIVTNEQGAVEQFNIENSVEQINAVYTVDPTGTGDIVTIDNYRDFDDLIEDTPMSDIPEDDLEAEQENESLFVNPKSYLSTDSDAKDGEEKILINPPKFKIRRRYQKQYVCPKCPNERYSENEFFHHIAMHGKVKNETFQCNQCSLSTSMSTAEFYEHSMRLHRYQCHICNMSFGKRGTHYAHMRRHSNVRYMCSFPGCNKSFMNSWSLGKHEHLHTGVERYKCTDCNVGFKTYDTYRYHLKTHNGRKYLCAFCGKSYLQSVHLKYHLWNHSGVKQFMCNQCPKSYTSITVLRKHKRKHHPDT